MTPPTAPAVTVVVATRNRWSELTVTLGKLSELPERPAVLVVDNASTDGTAASVRARHPDVSVLALPANLGAAARTIGARAATTPLVAFSDDDSWWAPGSLAQVAARFAADPALGLVAGRVLVGHDGWLDPTSETMASGALDEWLRRGHRGPRGVTGFLACAAVVRRAAFLGAGGFEPHLVIGGEEELVALDLADAGWKLVYAPDAPAHHHPSTARHAPTRRRLLARNRLLTSWLRYPVAVAWARSTAGTQDRPTASEWAWALRSAGWALSHRRAVHPTVARAFGEG